MGCSSNRSSKTGIKIVTDSDKSSRVDLDQGQVLEVRLTSQPGTGYKWYLDPKSTEKLKLIEESQTKPKSAGYDRPVLQIFRFRAEQVGTGVLRLNYIRPWEKSVPPEKSYEVSVLVK
jgi:inhibitor of cysteine peptidase